MSGYCATDSVLMPNAPASMMTMAMTQAKTGRSMKIREIIARFAQIPPEAIRPAGNHIFNGQWSAGPGSRGFALADALMGLPRQILASIDIFDPNFRHSHAMPWVQDDWKISRNLTLNLGLRYEWMGRMAANRDTISNFYRTGPNAAVIITPRDTGTRIWLYGSTVVSAYSGTPLKCAVRTMVLPLKNTLAPAG